jgi:hypothetical protein
MSWWTTKLPYQFVRRVRRANRGVPEIDGTEEVRELRPNLHDVSLKKVLDNQALGVSLSQHIVSFLAMVVEYLPSRTSVRRSAQQER